MSKDVIINKILNKQNEKIVKNPVSLIILFLSFIIMSIIDFPFSYAISKTFSDSSLK